MSSYLTPFAADNSKERIMKLEIDVPEASLDHAKKLSAFVAAGKQAISDGWQGGDVPAILLAAVSDLVPFFQGLDAVKAEFKADPFGAVMAFAGEIKNAI